MESDISVKISEVVLLDLNLSKIKSSGLKNKAGSIVGDVRQRVGLANPIKSSENKPILGQTTFDVQNQSYDFKAIKKHLNKITKSIEKKKAS